MSSILYEELNKECCKDGEPNIFGIPDPVVFRYWQDENRYTLVLDVENDVAVKLYQCPDAGPIRFVVYTNGVREVLKKITVLTLYDYEARLVCVGDIEINADYTKESLLSTLESVRNLLNRKHLYIGH